MVTTALEQLVGKVGALRDLPEPEVRRQIRQDAGASLQDIAAVVGVSRQAVYFWETNARTPRGANLADYVAVLRALRRAVAEP